MEKKKKTSHMYCSTYHTEHGRLWFQPNSLLNLVQ